MNPAIYQIEFRSVSKKFGSFPANDSISFGIRKNTVHSVIGENGAGKTTLMNILFGIYKQDSGKIFLDGTELNFASPLDAIECGIGMLHQHFQLIDDFTVMENVILGREKTGKSHFLDFGGSRKVLDELINKYSLGIDPAVKLSELSISEKQKVEILKLLYRNPEILIFDEPTAVLSPLEVDQFYRIISTFKSEGKTIILITHKLNEIKDLSDYLTVLRKGQVVYETDAINFDIPSVSREIIGSVNLPEVKTERINSGKNDVCLKMEDIVYKKEGVFKLNGFNLEIRKNEIFGVTGVEGNGQSEIVELILGHAKKFSGKTGRLPACISIVPDDRIKKGMIKEFTIGENVLLRNGEKKIINSSGVKSVSEKIISDFDIRVSDINTSMEELSGGNQQKAIFGRETVLENELMIFVHPTRGVDINATTFIHNVIMEQRNSGKAVLLITSDLDEALLLSDRIGILYRGSFIRVFDAEELRKSERESKEKLTEDLGKFMIGINVD